VQPAVSYSTQPKTSFCGQYNTAIPSDNIKSKTQKRKENHISVAPILFKKKKRVNPNKINFRGEAINRPSKNFTPHCQ
jgi:hypothetical protein